MIFACPSVVTITFGGLEIAMDDAGRVRAGERFRDLDREIQRARRRERTARERVAQRLARTSSIAMNVRPSASRCRG
jgi:hypothetical protein